MSGLNLPPLPLLEWATWRRRTLGNSQISSWTFKSKSPPLRAVWLAGSPAPQHTTAVLSAPQSAVGRFIHRLVRYNEYISKLHRKQKGMSTFRMERGQADISGRGVGNGETMGTGMDQRTERDSREERLTPAICQVKHRETTWLFR
eukprot:superscaffoldBa00001997_g12791